MLTGDIRGKIDSIWNAFWTGGISNPLDDPMNFEILNPFENADTLPAKAGTPNL